MKAGPSIANGMTREHFALVRDLFHRAVVLSATERMVLLARECSGHEELRTAVEQLLNAEGTASDRFDPDSGSIARRLLDTQGLGAMEACPEQIGPYRVRRCLGRGGMGEVYLAEQSNPRREVAIKVLRCGSRSGSLHSRFSREVRALGRLEHPGIARIYEAGVTKEAGGQLPYFAMEYVCGPRLTDFASEKKLGLGDRLELVARIADAVQHAHTKGVIHRDLKPSNILVAGSGEVAATETAAATRSGFEGPQPKILDFGVARVFGPDEECTAVTEAGQLIGTLAYMSPEQLAGDQGAVDARADVYSIGVILFELLTGRLPHDVRSKPVPEAARVVRDEEPAALNARGGGPVGVLDLDVETIVAHAMAKDRERRYTTAAALAEDLRRYQRDEPIQARPATATYQLSKLARRNRGLVVGAACAVLALVVGLAASTVLFSREQRARRRADEKERLSGAVQGYLVDGLLMAAAPDRMGHDVKMLEVLAHAADGLHDRFAEAPEVEASIRGELADVLAKVGKFQESVVQWDLAIPLLERVFGPDDRRTISALIKESGAEHRLANRRRSISLAVEALDRARRTLPAGDPLIVAALNQIGTGHMAAGRISQALPYLREGLELAQQAPVENGQVIVSLQSAINECESRKGLAKDPVGISRQIADRAGDSLGEESPTAINAKSNLLLTLVKEGRADEAVAIAAGLPAAAERTFAPGHVMRGYVYRSSADSFRIAGRFEEAERLALLSFDVFSHASPQLIAETDVCIEQLRAVYVGWPGHGEQLREWCVRGVGLRMLRTRPSRWFSVPQIMKQVDSELAAAGVPLSREVCLDLVWQQRDEIAPPGDPGRALFFANFARMCASAVHCDRVDEAIRLSVAALPDAARANDVRLTLEKATSTKK